MLQAKYGNMIVIGDNNRVTELITQLEHDD